MIPPDTLLKLDSPDLAGARAAVQTVKPAVGAPCQVIRNGLGVLHSEPRQQYLWIGVGHVIPITIRIEQQVGQLQYINAPVTERETR